MPGTVYDRKGDALIRIEFTDHLEHQQLVEIGIEQAAHDRVEPPAVVVSPGCDICHCHAGTLSRPWRPNQWVLAAAWQLSGRFAAGFARRLPTYPPKRAYPGQIAA